MRILLSNDDGVHAPGLRAVYDELKKMGSVTVVAPLEEKSTTGHNLTLHKPLRLIEIEKDFYGVSGSPADCIYLGIQQVLGKKKPDLVVSGINRGANLGQDVYYSGTVSAAREACILGIPSVAVSLAIDFQSMASDEKLNYPAAAKVLRQVLREFDLGKLPSGTLLNLNVPDRPFKRIRGIRVAHQGFRHYSGEVLRRKDHRGRFYYWVGGRYSGFREDSQSDCHVVEEGYASVTPLQLDCTHFAFLHELSGHWPLAGAGRPERPRRNG